MKKIPRDMRTKIFEPLIEKDTVTDSYEVDDYVYHIVQYKITDIQVDVTVIFQGSLDNENWFNLSDETTITSDGEGKFTYKGALKYIRFYFKDETLDSPINPLLPTAIIEVIYFGL